jgi:uncharacterized protein YggE
MPSLLGARFGPHAIAAVLGPALGLLPALVAAQEGKAEPRTISVSGTGRVSARPDVAEIHLGVVTASATARSALQENNVCVDRLISLLKERGIDVKDIRTTQIHAMPRYDHSSPRPHAGGGPPEESLPRVSGYRVENLVRITVRALDKLGPLLDSVVEGGACQVRGITFRVDRFDELLAVARKSAVESARKKAEDLARWGSVEVGLPLKMEEQDGLVHHQQPRIYAGGPMVTATPSMPILPGEEEVTVTVSIVYEVVPRAPRR